MPEYAIRPDRRTFIGGSDARIVVGDDEAALLRLWLQKRGEVEPDDLSATHRPAWLGHRGGRAEVLALRGKRRAPSPIRVEPPKPRIQAVRIVDISGSNAWAEFAGIFARTRAVHLQHEQAKTELKSLMPDDAKEAIGHGIRAKRSKSGAVSFDLLVQEGSHAARQ